MWLAAVASLLASAALVHSQQLDPIRNYCARFDHSCMNDMRVQHYEGRCSSEAAQIKHAAIYIDGGTQSFIDVDDTGKQTGNVTMGISRRRSRSL